MIEIKYKTVWPFIAVAITVFMAVAGAFVCYGIFDAKNNVDSTKTVVDDFVNKNIFISVQNGDTNTLDTNVIVSFDPKDKTIKTITVPADTRIKVATSDQMFKDVINIGGVEMLRNVIADIVPIPVDYHLIIKTTDLYSGDLSYSAAIKYIFSEALWQQGNLNEYLKQILSVSSTDLTLLKINEYSDFINKFKEHTNQYYTVPGTHTVIADRVFYIPDINSINELINTEILN
ncbi:MAG: LCP family protein [Clostridia bacterium]|nr:LCP family protein [Clostridia bacterium]